MKPHRLKVICLINIKNDLLIKSTSSIVPQPPLNLVAKWDKFRFLELEWQNPNKTNGPLLGFEIIVNGEKYFYQKPENTTYTYKVGHISGQNNIMASQTLVVFENYVFTRILNNIVIFIYYFRRNFNVNQKTIWHLSLYKQLI